jgi:hypothetical protein
LDSATEDRVSKMIPGVIFEPDPGSVSLSMNS